MISFLSAAHLSKVWEFQGVIQFNKECLTNRYTLPGHFRIGDHLNSLTSPD